MVCLLGMHRGLQDCYGGLLKYARVFPSLRSEITKQQGFVKDLMNYSSQQWVEFFRIKASTAQAPVEEIGQMYRNRDGKVCSVPKHCQFGDL